MSEPMIIREAILASKEIHEIYMRRLPEQARPLREEYCQDYEREKIIEKHIDAATRELRAKVKELEAALTGSNELLQRYFDLFTDMKKRLEDSKTEEEQG